GRRHAHHPEGKKAGVRLRNSDAAPTPHKLSKRELAAIEAMCREAPSGVCDDSGPRAPKNRLSPARLVGGLNQLARTLIVKLQLPDPTPRFGPDPSVNEWKMAAVGYPLWLWTDGPTVVSSRVRAYGITFTLRADWQSTTFDMGDGHQVTCRRTVVYPTNTRPGRKSPACGYTYLTSSLPRGNYTVTATTNWRISWSALGQSGSLPGAHTGQWSLPVGELNALVVK
ncbi:MAG TPA: hypothetical protein VFW55_00445, partial [Propionicimonas sp.]|nr:hypothetical protein [Propionicimonas sp.]